MMTVTEQNFVRYWGRLRSRGRERYLLVNAGSYTVLLTFGLEAANASIFNRGDYEFRLSWLLLRFLLMALGSFLFYLYRWHTNEKSFNRLMPKDKGAL